MELNAVQVIKALECCSKGTTEDCAKCPRFDGDRTLSTEDCMEILMRNALALIKQLTEEIADLKAISEQYQKQFEDCYEEKAKLTDENERLMTECGNQSILWKQHFESIYETAKETVRANTVREMQKRLHGRFGDDANRVFSNYNIHRYIDRIAKEMLEGKQ